MDGRVDVYALGCVLYERLMYGAAFGVPMSFSERVGCRRLLPLWEGLPDLSALCLAGKS